MKPKILFILCALTAISCDKKYDCYFTSENLYTPYYPYYKGQEIHFHNGKGDTIAYTVEIKREKYVTELSYNCDCVCKSKISYTLLSDGAYNIMLTFGNTTRSSRETGFYFSCEYNETYSGWMECCSFEDYGNDRYFEKIMGETIPYGNPYVDSRYSGGKHIRDIIHKKGKGLMSFYDADSKCTWYLVEQ